MFTRFRVDAMSAFEEELVTEDQIFEFCSRHIAASKLDIDEG